MANTIPNTYLPAGQWVNLYADTGYSAGKQLRVQNLITNDVRIVVKATSPTDADGYTIIYPFQTLTNDTGDSGIWALCLSGGSVNCASVDSSPPTVYGFSSRFSSRFLQ
ncbi:hypothetical protein phiPLPE_32 [Iodobacter phage PhiPLPE]|uniref:Uncharacterized protein n=1 Tax=Iodobacter phage PhiPLPE TaxID=551895 RepID=B5AX51_9CAUD|nr:hypothetical protein phiPLPE_32 [Iodobacter phage PhiPLPE]ACG60354.1 hypothetical protein phiPLPE_32 [Iodobacter phage PhiPLPE]